jgi:hypothetical protein
VRSGHLILGTLSAFVGAGVVSAAYYPGGSWLDRRAAGHDLVRNFLCDLLAPVAINGQPNLVGSVAMMAGMGVFALGLALYWWSMPRLFSSVALTRAVRGCGVVSTLGLLAVPLTPPTESYQLHAAAVFSGGIPAFAAWILSLVAFSQRAETRRLAWLGLIALLLVGLGFGLYTREYFFRGGPSVMLPLSHRVATVAFLAWVIAVSRVLLSPRTK